MKCFNCGQENKDTARACKKCGRDMTLPPVWFPDWRWHVRTLATIYTVLIIAFFAAKWLLRRLPPPYDIRDIPADMTPWLKHKTPPDDEAAKAAPAVPNPYQRMGEPPPKP